MTIDVRNWSESYDIELKYKIVLILSSIHKAGKMSREKLLGQFKSLRSKDFKHKKNTYKSSITGIWYNDELTIDIYKNDHYRLGSPNIDIKDFIPYLQLYENKNYNYAVNILMEAYLKRLFDSWNPEYHGVSFSKFINLHMPFRMEADLKDSYKHRDSWGYSYDTCHCGCSCCNRKEYDKNDDQISKSISDFFHRLKKGDLKKIPYLEFKHIKGAAWGMM